VFLWWGRTLNGTLRSALDSSSRVLLRNRDFLLFLFSFLLLLLFPSKQLHLLVVANVIARVVVISTKRFGCDCQLQRILV